jgi:hypothetical protein
MLHASALSSGHNQRHILHTCGRCASDHQKPAGYKYKQQPQAHYLKAAVCGDNPFDINTSMALELSTHQSVLVQSGMAIGDMTTAE